MPSQVAGGALRARARLAAVGEMGPDVEVGENLNFFRGWVVVAVGCGVILSHTSILYFMSSKKSS